MRSFLVCLFSGLGFTVWLGSAPLLAQSLPDLKPANTGSNASDAPANSSPSADLVPEVCPAFSNTLAISLRTPVPWLTLTVENQPISLQLSGGTVFEPSSLQTLPAIEAMLTEVRGKNLSLTEFQALLPRLASAISQHYLNQGYVTSQANVKPVTEIPADGVVVLTLEEGGLSAIRIFGRGRLNLNYLCDRVALGVSTPINLGQIEAQLRLLQQSNLLSDVGGSLSNSGQAGLSILTVTVKEASTFDLNLSFDNYSPISLGSERGGISLAVNNVTGLGDRLSGSYYVSTTGGMDLADFSYEIPLNPMEGTLRLRATPTWTRVTQKPFDVLDITGTNPVYEISFRQPLIRTLQEEFALTVGFRYQDGRTLGLGRPELLGSSRTSVFQFSQDYLSRDPDGLWFARSLFNLGTGLFDATSNGGSLPSGEFFSWVGQVQRLQRLGNDHLLILQADVQLTPDSLLPDYLFVIGGGQSVRGYRQNARSGDNGIRFSAEDRITLARNGKNESVFEIAPFLDFGAVWNSAGNPTQLPSQTVLVSPGLGLIWNQAIGIEGLSLRVDYGIPIITLPDRSANLQNDGFYFQVNYRPRL